MKKIFILLLFTINVAIGQSITISPNNPDHIKVVKTGTARIDLEGKSVEGIHSGNSELNLYSKGTTTYTGPVPLPAVGNASINFLNSGTPYPIFSINNSHQEYLDFNSKILKISAGNNDHINFYPDGSMTFPSTDLHFLSDKSVIFGPLNSSHNANFVVNSKIGNTHAVFGNNLAGVSIESNPAGIGFNEYYDEDRKPIANGYVGGINLDPSNGTFRIYNSATSGTKASIISTTDRLIINNLGKVGFGNTSPNLNNDERVEIDGRLRIRDSTSTAGIWFNNSANGIGIDNGAFLGLENNTSGSERAGIWIGSAWRFSINRVGNANFTGTVTATGFPIASDIRYKKNIQPLENTLSKVQKIVGVSYDLRKDEFPEKNFSDQPQIGFIAQDLEKIFPEMVFTDEKGYKSVDYARLTPVLVEALKELTLKNQTLESRIDKIETMLSTIQPNTENSNSKK